ncbi:uroporphyrinogen-III synthase [Rhodobacteraceae bacterium KMM 6894]|nr:uroporphyrinogen-III synthase [Rhodobacteraceae bacterium KMM 6894]
MDPLTTVERTAMPTLLITRPEPGCTQFATMARDVLGDVPIVRSPVMAIEATGDLPCLDDIRALILTSPQGVAQFVARSARRDLPVFAVGDGTAQAAQAAGLNAVSARGDAADLVACILEQGVSGPMLHLRGTHAAGDVAGALRTVGIDAREAVIYAQNPQSLSAEALNVLKGVRPIVVPLFSPRSSTLVFDQMTPRAPLLVLAISAAVARMVPPEMAVRVETVDRPDAKAMLAALPELWQRAIRLEGDGAAQ